MVIFKTQGSPPLELEVGWMFVLQLLMFWYVSYEPAQPRPTQPQSYTYLLLQPCLPLSLPDIHLYWYTDTTHHRVPHSYHLYNATTSNQHSRNTILYLTRVSAKSVGEFKLLAIKYDFWKVWDEILILKFHAISHTEGEHRNTEQNTEQTNKLAVHCQVFCKYSAWPSLSFVKHFTCWGASGQNRNKISSTGWLSIVDCRIVIRQKAYPLMSSALTAELW